MRSPDLIDQVTDDAGVSTFINQDKVRARCRNRSGRTAGRASACAAASPGRKEKDDGSELVDSPNWLGKVVLGVPSRLRLDGERRGSRRIVAQRRQRPVPGYGIVNLSVFSAPAAFRAVQPVDLQSRRQKYDDPTSSYMLHESIEQNGRQFRFALDALPP